MVLKILFRHYSGVQIIDRNPEIFPNIFALWHISLILTVAIVFLLFFEKRDYSNAKWDVEIHRSSASVI
jgi:hypothetical protein